ncbi:TrkH family potassium uptake protein [Microtetraspora malaysiensis]|uniref:TrkH family potassium uptake protein n=1 Tax=Microtetraspora malaysiensis TaxID=161358 RepID=UPI000B054925
MTEAFGGAAVFCGGAGEVKGRQTGWGSAMLNRFQNPTQVLATCFGSVILLGTLLLRLPIATTSGESADWVSALFTATSAVCVTGLAIVDTGGHWSAFGEGVIAGLVQIGGFGIMILATLFTMIVSNRMGLRARLMAQAQTSTLTVADARRVVRNVIVFSLVSEAVVAVILTGRLMIGYGESFGTALYHGVFHAISAFNNAGFSLWPDSLTRFVSDPWICLTIAGAVIVGGLGVPVIFELLRSWRRPSRWTVLTRVTVVVTTLLLSVSTMVFLMTEWRNPGTLGALKDSDKLLASFFTAVMPRSSGFNTIDVSQMESSSWLVTDILMFVGAGSAGTGGGIKVTTLGLLAFVIWAEIRGEPQVNIGHRRLTESAQRQAVAICMLGVALVAITTYVLLIMTPHSLDQVLFEAVSAFSTTGLSTGITPDVPPAGHLMLVVLMFIGRIGPLTLGSALALKERTRRYELPEERVIVG